MIRHVKKEVRILGIDDAPFKKGVDKKVLVVGTVFRGGDYLDGLLSCYVRVDGSDATSKLTSMIRKTKHKQQLQCIMIDGIALGGFNVIDIQKLAKATKLPVIIIIRRMPNLREIKAALRHIRAAKKIKLLEKARKIHKLKIRRKAIYMQVAGIEAEKAAQVVKLAATRSLIPEPLRAAHLIASGIVFGESRGRV